VSYGLLYTTSSETVLGVVPLGYADGIPRHASGGSAGVGGPVLVGRNGPSPRVVRIAGRVCMDQVVLDLGPAAAQQAGDVVTLFGASDGVGHGTGHGVGLPSAELPSAEDWAQAAGTISYEIVTRIGTRVPRAYVGEEAS
jgi:alanine racemase